MPPEKQEKIREERKDTREKKEAERGYENLPEGDKKFSESAKRFVNDHTTLERIISEECSRVNEIKALIASGGTEKRLIPDLYEQMMKAAIENVDRASRTLKERTTAFLKENGVPDITIATVVTAVEQRGHFLQRGFASNKNGFYATFDLPSLGVSIDYNTNAYKEIQIIPGFTPGGGNIMSLSVRPGKYELNRVKM